MPKNALSSRPLVAFASLALAGTCFAAPATAMASDSLIDSLLAELLGGITGIEQPAQAPATVAADGNVAVSFGGLTVEIPADYEQSDLGSMMWLATSPDGGTTAVIFTMDLGQAIPYDSADFQAIIEQSVASEMENLGGGAKVSSTSTYETPSGATVLLYGLDFDKGAAVSQVAIAFVEQPGSTTFSFLEVATTPSATADELAAANTMLATLDVASPASSAASSSSPSSGGRLSIGGGKTTTVDEGTFAGMTCSIPKGYTLDKDSSNDEFRAWVSEDGHGAIYIVADVLYGASLDDFTIDDLNELADSDASSLSMAVTNTDTLETETTTVYLYAMANSEGTYYGILGYVPVEDGTLDCLVVTGDDFGIVFNETVQALYESVELAK